MILVARFVPNDAVRDGTLVALKDGKIMWAGHVTETPLDDFEEGTECHVHPALYERISAAAAVTGEGIPDVDFEG